SVGRGGRVLLRRAPPAGRHAEAAQSAVARRTDSTARGRDARARRARSAPGLPPPPRLVHRSPPESHVGGRLHAHPGRRDRRLLSIVDGDQVRRILHVMLDEREFLSPFGIRSISRIHRDRPYVLRVDGHEYRVDYEPAESTTGLFGGNSNWRGPIWFPINFLLVEALQKFHHY